MGLVMNMLRSCPPYSECHNIDSSVPIALNNYESATNQQQPLKFLYKDFSFIATGVPDSIVESSSMYLSFACQRHLSKFQEFRARIYFIRSNSNSQNNSCRNINSSSQNNPLGIRFECCKSLCIEVWWMGLVMNMLRSCPPYSECHNIDSSAQDSVSDADKSMTEHCVVA